MPAIKSYVNARRANAAHAADLQNETLIDTA